MTFCLQKHRVVVSFASIDANKSEFFRAKEIGDFLSGRYQKAPWPNMSNVAPLSTLLSNCVSTIRNAPRPRVSVSVVPSIMSSAASSLLPPDHPRLRVPASPSFMFTSFYTRDSTGMTL